jgi:hypothetical protein
MTSQAVRAFHAETEARAPMPVRLLSAGQEKTIEGWAAPNGLWVRWPLGGLYRLTRDGRLGRKEGLRDWWVHPDDLRELRRRRFVLR